MLPSSSTEKKAPFSRAPYTLFLLLCTRGACVPGVTCAHDDLLTLAKNVGVLSASLLISHLPLVCPSETWSRGWSVLGRYSFEILVPECSMHSEGCALEGERQGNAGWNILRFPFFVAFIVGRWHSGKQPRLLCSTVYKCVLSVGSCRRIKCSVKHGNIPVFFPYPLQRFGLSQCVSGIFGLL